MIEFIDNLLPWSFAVNAALCLAAFAINCYVGYRRWNRGRKR